MLNSYKDLQRWFPALEPEHAAPRGRVDPDLEQALAQGCAARYPHYIRETEPEPFDIPFAVESAQRRSEFIGGWSDWVAGDHAPGPDDDYPTRDAKLVQFPWGDDSGPDDADLAPSRRRMSADARRSRDAGRARTSTGADTADDDEHEREDATDSQDREAARARRGGAAGRRAKSATPREAADRSGTAADRPAADSHESADGPAVGPHRAGGHANWLADDDWPGAGDAWPEDDWSAEAGGNRARSGRRGRFRAAVRAWRAASDRPARSDRSRRGGPGAAAAPRTLREQARPGRSRVAVVLVVAVLLLAAAAGGFALYLLHGRDGAAHAVRPADSGVRLTGATTGTMLACPTEYAGPSVRGAEPGGTGSGPEAVMWFQHAYYVERSAERAREVVAPGAAVSPAAVIQRGIDSVPAGTAYCVLVAPAGENRYSVEVTEQRPGGAPATYDRQTVTTAVVGGRTLITGIAAG